MKALLEMMKIARRAAVPGVAAVLAALSVGAYAGHAAVNHDPDHDGDCDVACLQPTFTLAATPRKAVLRVGSSARFRIRIRRTDLAAAVSLRVVSKLPAGVSVRFSHSRTWGRRSQLVLRTSWRVAPGRYRLRVRGWGGGVTRRLTLTLTIIREASRRSGQGSSGGAGAASSGGTTTASSAPFRITGDAAAPLEPGVEQALDLELTNPNSAPLTITNLTVNVESVSAPAATPALPCTRGDFAVWQFSGLVPLTVAASSTTSLAALGIPPGQWPQIALLDLSSDQDGCQGASLTLAYSGSGRLG